MSNVRHVHTTKAGTDCLHCQRREALLDERHQAMLDVGDALRKADVRIAELEALLREWCNACDVGRSHAIYELWKETIIALRGTENPSSHE